MSTIRWLQLPPSVERAVERLSREVATAKRRGYLPLLARADDVDGDGCESEPYDTHVTVDD